ncbi:MAG: DUF4105 domain-containing protein, partial [Bdellovibrionales bacterium]|nr:DUF4105 domain-containing protein [Bdellovibrionales bacterium]
MIWTLLFLFLSSPSSAQSNDRCFESNLQKLSQNEVWKDKRWLGIVHYREGLISPKSEADGASFFISPEGSSDPKSELIELVKAYCENRSVKTQRKELPEMPARCLFPAREQLLESLGLSGWPKPECDALKAWKRKIGDDTVSLVFSSYYANNPSTVFGHTLLRVDRKQEGSLTLVNPLLSYGINFAAEPNTDNPFLYSILGMVGGFPGIFTSLPYYYKVREYSDFDSRDLWEYRLKMSESQKELLINHIWEQSFSHYNYFYFTENCSYHLLTTLDVALPDFDLASKIPYWVIPIDTVKAVTTTPGLVEEVTFRPSLYRQFKARLARLEEKGIQDHFYQYLKTKEFSSSLTEDEQALVMDAVLDYWDFKNAKDLLDPKSSASKVKMGFLKARAPLPTTPKLEFDKNKMERPDVSHETFRLGTGFDYESQISLGLTFDFRFALHDFLDPRLGYPKNSQVQFAKLNVTHAFKDNKFKLNELTLFDVQLLSPLTRLNRSYSWRAKLGAESDYTDCLNCLSAKGLFQGGAAFGLFDDRWITY